MDRLTFLISNNALQLLVLKSYAFDLDLLANKQQEKIQKIIEEDECLGLDYQKINIGLANHKSVLVPDKLYDESQKVLYLSNQVALAEGDAVFNNDISTIEAKNVYAVKYSVNNFLSKLYPKAKIIHASSALIQAYQDIAKTKSQTQFFANVKKGVFEIMVFDKEKLLLTNSFEYQTSTDFIYFIMLIYNQLKLDPETIPLNLSGLVLRDSEIYKMLYRYIRNINFLDAPAKYFFSDKAEAFEKHFYFDTFSLSLCE